MNVPALPLFHDGYWLSQGRNPYESGTEKQIGDRLENMNDGVWEKALKFKKLNKKGGKPVQVIILRTEFNELFLRWRAGKERIPAKDSRLDTEPIYLDIIRASNESKKHSTGFERQVLDNFKLSSNHAV